MAKRRETRSAPGRVPVSTYLLQFQRGFRFADAALVSYLSAFRAATPPPKGT
jgi:hypothetical protein